MKEKIIQIVESEGIVIPNAIAKKYRISYLTVIKYLEQLYNEGKLLKFNVGKCRIYISKDFIKKLVSVS